MEHLSSSSSFKSTTLLTLLLLTFAITSSINQISALLCSCNLCGNETQACELPNDGESTCYVSVVRRLDEKTNKFGRDYSYGCLKGAGSLGPLLCHTNALKHTDPTSMKCCRNYDMCNDYLPDPTVDDDPRWGIPDEESENLETETNFISYKTFFTYFGFICSTIFIILGLVRCTSYFIIKCSRSSRDSKGSTCSLKADVDRFHHLQNSSSSSASTHSYSVSDDLCHKAPESSANEDSYIPDLTSGIGEKMLNPRTMARAVGSGNTDVVGNGRFGRVIRGQYHGEDVAVKAFKTIDQDSWKREDTIFRFLNHDSIVRFIASEVTSVDNTSIEIWMFLEYCPYGSLCDYLDHNEILGPQQAVKILYTIINGLNYLHEDYAKASKFYKPSIAHRDIKSRNILMKTPDSCCIADFGHALIKMDEDMLDYGKYQHLQVGTIRYMAPEILRPMTETLNYRQFSTFAQADLYQYGLILWEVCNRTALDILHPAGDHKLPYDGVVPQNPDIPDMIKIVCEDQYRPPRYDKWYQYAPMKQLAVLMVECWRPNPLARMETLGVKKKMKELLNEIAPVQAPSYQLNLHNNFHS